MLRHAIRVCCLSAAVAGFMAVPALAAAGGAGTETFTEHGHEVPFFSFPAANPCTGEAGTISAVATNFVFHITEQADGEHWITGTGEGVATFTPEQLAGVSARGHFTAWFGEALNQKNSVEHDTNTIVLRATDGSHIVIHAKSHISTNAKGEPTVEFEREKMSARCG